MPYCTRLLLPRMKRLLVCAHRLLARVVQHTIDGPPARQDLTVIIFAGWRDDTVQDVIGNRRHDRIMMAPVESSRSGRCISPSERQQHVPRKLRHEPVAVTWKLLHRLHSFRLHLRLEERLET